MDTTQIERTRGLDTDSIPNGAAAAAILAAGIGCAMVGMLAFAGDASRFIGNLLNFYNPAGTLSGVSTVAIVVWLVSWAVLHQRWSGRTIDMARINGGAFLLLAAGFLLTFPPFMDLLQGK